MDDPGEIDAQTPAEFLWLLLIPLVVGMVFVGLTCLFRTKDTYEKRIYAPMLLLNQNEDGTGDKLGIQYMPKGAFAWIKELFKYNEGDVLRTRGADKAVFLMVEKLIIKLALIFSVLGWVILVPIYMTSGGTLQPSIDVWFNQFSLSRVEPKSSRLWASMIMCYLFSFISFWFLMDLTRKIAKIRIESLSIGDAGIKAFSTLVTDLPSQPEDEEYEKVDGMKDAAPLATKEEPTAMVWANLSTKKARRYWMSKAVTGLLILLVLFWMIPVFFVASLTTLSNLEKWLPFIKDLPEWFRS
eukprot:jgi/Pico_ML_1/50740/g1897.t1